MSSTVSPMQSLSDQPVLVLGLGNILFQDEGIGVRAVERIREEYDLPENVTALDGGTLGLDLLVYFAGNAGLIILDAVRSGKTPGSLIRLDSSEIPAALALKLSMHQLGLQDLMAANLLRGSLPEQVVLWGVEPAVIDWGTELSPIAAAALAQLVKSAVDELRRWDIQITRRG